MQPLAVKKITNIFILACSIIMSWSCQKTSDIQKKSPSYEIAEITAAKSNSQWVDGWAASFLSTTVSGVKQSVPSFNKQTFRLNVFTKLGGTKVKVKLTNKFGTNSLSVASVHIALRSSNNSIVKSSDRKLTFKGKSNVTLAPGAEIWSDSVSLNVGQFVTVAISLYISGSYTPTTFHQRGLHTSYISKAGDYTSSSTLPLASSNNTTTAVFMVSDLQVWAPTSSKVAVCFGNSITDGSGATNNANGTWLDVLSKRIPRLPSGTPFSVINMGIGSNRVVSSDLAGPSGVHRFANDVLARPNVGYVLLLEGINDISLDNATATAITDAYATLIAQAHAAGLKIYGATLLPIGKSNKYTVENEAKRQAVNEWIRTPGNFDAVLDFEAVVKDLSTNPLAIRSDMTADYVHPNAAGYLAIGNSIPVELFE